MVAGKVMTSAVWDQEEELLDNPDFNVIMEECMNEPQKWKLAVTSKYLSEKNRSHLSELEITTSNYWQIVHRSKLFKKMSGIKMGLIKL
jgi:RNA polymerase sigma-70 factor (ECF subfamily)